MADYIPTTEEIREGFPERPASPLRFVGVLRSDFDRWLAQHDKEVLEKAVQRLHASHPKLSQTLRDHWGGNDYPKDECDCCANHALIVAVAAVRGEGTE